MLKIVQSVLFVAVVASGQCLFDGFTDVHNGCRTHYCINISEQQTHNLMQYKNAKM